ncbi:MAG: hypothetical protein K9L30_15535 [Desulfobacterales bacterium]|nr:hypothetical protein [Desulfobacterales bacterium]
MKSLLFVGFPRGVTSTTYTISASMLPFLKETGISTGEILNHQRNEALTDKYPFYISDNHPDFNTAYLYFKLILDKYAENHIIKDVVQPYIVLRYLKENPEKYNVIFINRNLEHIKFALEYRGWDYTFGLDYLYDRFSRYSEIKIDQAIYDEDYIPGILSRYYDNVITVHYISQKFLDKTDDFLFRFHRKGWGNSFHCINRIKEFDLQGFTDDSAENEPLWTTSRHASISVNLKDLFVKPEKLLIKAYAPSEEFKNRVGVSIILSESNTKKNVVFTPKQRSDIIEIDLTNRDINNDKIKLEINNNDLCKINMPGCDHIDRQIGIGVYAIAVYGYDKDLVKRTEARNTARNRARIEIIKEIEFSKWFKFKFLLCAVLKK